MENQRPTHSVETVLGHEGIKQMPIYYSFPSRFKTAYKLELEHFLDVVQGTNLLLNVSSLLGTSIMSSCSKWSIFIVYTFYLCSS